MFNSYINSKVISTLNNIKYNLISYINKKKIITDLKKKLLGINIETTNICNANCIFCAYQFQSRKTGIMDLEMYKKIIRTYSSLGGGDIGLTPTVGEPLADKHIVERIKFARNFKNIKKIGFYSNLISLEKFDLIELINSGISDIAVSTSGFSEEMYEQIYRSSQYKRMYRNLKNLVIENNKFNNPINIVVDMRSNRSINETINLPDYKELLKYLPVSKFFYKFRYDDWAGKIKQSDLNGTMKLRGSMNLLKIRFSPCTEYFSGPMIYWNGDVGICGCRDVDAKDLIIGNLTENNFDKIWYNQKHLELIKKFHVDTPLICKSCTHYNNISVYASADWKKKIEKLPNIFS
jgi:MoaA/NifB/PqqE/SkfB family radical SAM enzyme